MKFLVVEDDRRIRQGLVEVLRTEGYEVAEAADGVSAMQKFHAFQPDFVCLDIMIPQTSGYDVCREIRKTNQSVPIIFITAKSEEVDKVLGLELGADDFIVKPFGVKEVIARIRAIVRRSFPKSNDDTFEMDDLIVSPKELRARRRETTIELSLRDIKILQTLYNRAGEAVDRSTLFNEVWGTRHLPNSRTLDQHVSQLRKRIEVDPAKPVIIKTVHGVGYRYDK